jgi:hypothetical protein
MMLSAFSLRSIAAAFGMLCDGRMKAKPNHQG